MPHIKSFQGTDCSKSKRGLICGKNLLKPLSNNISHIDGDNNFFKLKIRNKIVPI